jgi:hypothetical protein
METICAPAQAVRLPPGVTRTAADPVAEQLQQIDNGHLPIFDLAQWTRDIRDDLGNVKPAPHSRFDIPWGRLIYEYFTALPLEELTRRYNFQAINDAICGTTNNCTGMRDFGTDTRMLDLTAAQFEQAYGYFFSGYDASGRKTGAYPLLEPVAEAQAEKGSPLGPKVRGRINVNYAPWWVLDGLPVLPDGPVGTNLAIPPAPQTQSLYPLAGLPVPELWSGYLDPAAYNQPNPEHDPAARLLSDALFDPGNPNAGAGTKLYEYLPSVSPTLAKYMVSYRDTQPGFVTMGALADLVWGITVPEINTKGDGNTAYTLPDDNYKTLEQVRWYSYLKTSGNENTRVRPYAYLGWLQFVAPLVRVQDWATVRNHAFTIYASVGDTTDPRLPMWMRKQVTVDRTACLYKDELPQKVTETLPIAYQNAVDDK